MTPSLVSTPLFLEDEDIFQKSATLVVILFQFRLLVQVIPSGSDALRIGRKSGILRFIKLKKKERIFLEPDF
jgi:hypothetical protein